jgi:hypothetical protein
MTDLEKLIEIQKKYGKEFKIEWLKNDSAISRFFKNPIKSIFNKIKK